MGGILVRRRLRSRAAGQPLGPDPDGLTAAGAGALEQVLEGRRLGAPVLRRRLHLGTELGSGIEGRIENSAKIFGEDDPHLEPLLNKPPGATVPD